MCCLSWFAVCSFVVCLLYALLLSCLWCFVCPFVVCGLLFVFCHLLFVVCPMLFNCCSHFCVTCVVCCILSSFVFSSRCLLGVLLFDCHLPFLFFLHHCFRFVCIVVVCLLSSVVCRLSFPFLVHRHFPICVVRVYLFVVCYLSFVVCCLCIVVCCGSCFVCRSLKVGSLCLLVFRRLSSVVC